MRPLHRATVLVPMIVVLALTACAPTPGSDRPLHGVGSFRFAPEGRTPITVHYTSDAPDPASATIVVVMHGTERNPAAYRDSWTPLVRGRNAIVVAPEFPSRDFPGAEGYNLGGVVDRDGDARPEDTWTFGYIEPLFRDVVAKVGGHQTSFVMFGHSAGAQFVHRYLAFEPKAPVARAVAANAGWYTVPDPEVRFPYGWKKAPGGSLDAAAYFARRLTILLGARDTEDENLRQDEGAAAQGSTRLARGEHFYDVAREEALRDGLRFGWSLQIVPEVDHDHPRMAEAAVPILLPER